MNILVVSTEEYLTLRLLKCLAPLKACVHILGPGPNPVLSASRHCRHYFAARSTALSSGIEIEQYCRCHQIDVVLPSGMASVFLLSKLRTKLASRLPGTHFLPTPTPEQLQLLNNKWTFAQFMQRNGLPLPKSCLIESAGAVLSLDLTYPVIVKPLEMDAGRGVKRCETPGEVKAHAELFCDQLPLIVQEYIPGTDFGLGILARNGRIAAWTIQRQRPDGSGVDFIEQKDILEIGRRIIALFRCDGIVHFDLRIDSRDGSVKVLECNPRFWASLPFSQVAGVNFAILGVQLALDQPLPNINYQTVGITFPTRILAGAMRGDAACWRLSISSRRALQAFWSDPLPLACLAAQRGQRKMAGLFSK